MGEFSTLNIYAGLTAFSVALVLGAGPLVFVLFKFTIGLSRVDEEKALRAGNRAVAINLGAMLICQAILIRHAVPAVMEVIRTLFVYQLPAEEAWGLIRRSALFATFIIALSFLSVGIAGRIFTLLTRKLEEEKEIVSNNVAVALFYAMVLFAITLVLNEGMDDLSRSFVPYGRTGILN